LGLGAILCRPPWRGALQAERGIGRSPRPAFRASAKHRWLLTRFELAIKVLDGRAVNGSFWVFYGALSDVQYDVTVTDTTTGQVRTYHNTAGTLASVADTKAF
jgi:hypothetical protein